MCVAAWAYITAALSMGFTALMFVERSGWEVPRQLLGPLVYWIFVCSVLGYYVVTWATQHLPASQVCACLMLYFLDQVYSLRTDSPGATCSMPAACVCRGVT